MLYSPEGVLPHPRPRFPRGGACVCAGVRALACAYVCGRVWACACASYPARARACVCYACAILGKATGKPCAIHAIAWAAQVCSALAFFRRLLTRWLVTCQRMAIHWLSTC
ncbi:hypothetical protein VPP93_gp43 [Vibrio phage VP93]|uniref:Uncharacterized protein n=1 Tax=Vibrio phage VP93 TaxID=641832 RepID=C3VVT3_9CAUD|nr:hypothetical protein VPP93_gp43 [Vibrio phage VP93]ACP44114.1 hypothetical protein VPP93_gp43 [Vibrio phage VP93]